MEELSKATIDAYDIRNTIKAHKLGNIKRVHVGTANEDTLEDLIDDVIQFLEELAFGKEFMNLPDELKGTLQSYEEE